MGDAVRQPSHRSIAWGAFAALLVLAGVSATCRGSSDRNARPKVVLIIDDFGYVDSAAVGEWMALPVPFTAAVLPYQAMSQASAELAAAAGKEVILHLPMAGHEGSDPGPDALRVTLAAESLGALTRKALGDIPHIRGANNHMGSSFTEDSARLDPVLREIAGRKLYFIDSRTSSRSTGERVARALGVPTSHRDVFLDNDKAASAIEGAWDRGLRIARKNGSVVMIGHVYPETLGALRRLIARDSSRVTFVVAGEVVR